MSISISTLSVALDTSSTPSTGVESMTVCHRYLLAADARSVKIGDVVE